MKNIINKNRAYFDKNMYIKICGKKAIVYSDLLQVLLVTNDSFAEQLHFFQNNVRFGEIIKFDYRNEFINNLVTNKLLFFNKKDFYLKRNKVKVKFSTHKSKRKINYFYLHLTRKCNLACEYCYNKEILNKDSNLSFDEWVKVIDKLNLDSDSHVVLTGGEVLMRNDLVDICKYISKYKCFLEILTNGILLDKQMEVLDYVNDIVISMDSMDNKYTVRKNTKVDKLISNLKQIDHKYKDKILIRSVLTKFNQDQIEQMKTFVNEELGFRLIINDLVPTCFSDFSMMSNKKITTLDCDLKNVSFSRCTACKETIAIDSNGDIYPCQALIKKELKIGNIFEKVLIKTINKSSIAKSFDAFSLDQINECNNCNIKYICGGGCRAIAFNLYNDCFAYNKDMCKLFKNNIDNRLRIITGIDYE